MKINSLNRLRVHHGHNIKRLRKEKKMSQETIAKRACLSQQTVSRYETMQVIDDEMLVRFAKALDIPVQAIKVMEEETDSNLLLDYDSIEKGKFLTELETLVKTSDNFYKPIDKIIKLCNEKIAIYEHMLEMEKEKIAWLEKLREKRQS